MLCERLRDEATLDRLLLIINRSLAKPAEFAPRIQALSVQLSELDQKIEAGARKLLLCDNDLMAELSTVLRELKQQRAAVEAEMAALKSRDQALGAPSWSKRQLIDALASLADRMETVPNDELQRIMKNTIDRVQLTFDTIDGVKSRLSGGEIHISDSPDSGMAGAGFEPTTSRL